MRNMSKALQSKKLPVVDASEEAFELVYRLLRSNFDLYQQKIRMMMFYKTFLVYFEQWLADEQAKSGKKISEPMVMHSELHHRFVSGLRELKTLLYDPDLSSYLDLVKYPNVFYPDDDSWMVQMDKLLMLQHIMKYDSTFRFNITGQLVLKHESTVSSLCCQFCLKVFGSPLLMQHHQVNGHPSRYICFNCRLTFGYKNGFRNHLRSCFPKNRKLTVQSTKNFYRCDWPDCTGCLKTLQQLKYHKWKAHILDYPMIRCTLNDCGLQSNLNLCYTTHLEIYKRRKFQRLFNNGHRIVPKLPDSTKPIKDLTTTGQIKLVEKRVGSLDSKNPPNSNILYRCKHEQCAGLPLFKSEKAFAAHAFHTHGSRKPYVCDWPGCNKRIKSRYYLQTHRMSHELKASMSPMKQTSTIKIGQHKE